MSRSRAIATRSDLCFAETTLVKLRKDLGARYPTVEALNRRVGDDVPVVLARAAVHGRRDPRAGARPRPAAQPRAVAEHRAFMDKALAATPRTWRPSCAGHDPSLRCGLFGMQPPRAYGGHDLAQLLPFQAACEVYDEGGAGSLARALAPAVDAAVRDARAEPQDSVPRHSCSRASAELVAHGIGGGHRLELRARARRGRGRDRIRAALGAAFARLAPAFELGGGRPPPAEVVIVESQASVRPGGCSTPSATVRRGSGACRRTSPPTARAWRRERAGCSCSRTSAISRRSWPRPTSVACWPGRRWPRVVVLAWAAGARRCEPKALVDAARRARSCSPISDRALRREPRAAGGRLRSTKPSASGAPGPSRGAAARGRGPRRRCGSSPVRQRPSRPRDARRGRAGALGTVVHPSAARVPALLYLNLASASTRDCASTPSASRRPAT
jgi:hypothetical protein